MSMLVAEARTPPTSEELLVEYATTRSASAFEEFHNRHRDEVFWVALKYLHDPNDADDVTQEVFIRIHQRPDTYDPEQPVRPWLARTVANQAINFRERVKMKMKRHIAEGPDEDRAQDVPDHRELLPQENVLQREAAVRVQKLVARLPEIERQVVHMLYFEAVTQQEAARLLAIPIGTVKSRNRRAIESLRRMLRQGADSNATGAPAA